MTTLAIIGLVAIAATVIGAYALRRVSDEGPIHEEQHTHPDGSAKRFSPERHPGNQGQAERRMAAE